MIFSCHSVFEYSDNRNVIVGKSTQCIYRVCTMIDRPLRSFLTVNKHHALIVSMVYINVKVHKLAGSY